MLNPVTVAILAGLLVIPSACSAPVVEQRGAADPVLPAWPTPAPEAAPSVAESAAVDEPELVAQPTPAVEIVVPPPIAIQPRSAWATTPVAEARANPLGEPWRITIHHTGEDHHVDLTGGDLLRRIEYGHVVNRGWAAVGYHFLIAADGSVWEGRPLRYQGAHAQGENNHGNIGIALAGHFHEHGPPPAQLESMIRLLDDLCAEHAIPAWEVHGHRHFCHTDCPGDALLAAVAHWRRQATQAIMARLKP